MESRGIAWAGVMGVLILLAFVVPYALLAGVEAWYGSFLFWIVFTLVAIAVIATIVGRWED